MPKLTDDFIVSLKEQNRILQEMIQHIEQDITMEERRKMIRLYL